MEFSTLEAQLENLRSSGYDQYPASPPTPYPPNCYNCIAHAAGHTDAWWWPSPNKFLYYWPPHLPRESPGAEMLENFIHAFEWKGFQRCQNGAPEAGVEKVALFLKDNRPTHVARQLESGVWTSKCGKLQDIQHATLAAVEGRIHGQSVVYLHRRRPGWPV